MYMSGCISLIGRETTQNDSCQFVGCIGWVKELVWSPLARGFLSGKYRRDQPPPAGTRLEAWKDSFRSLDNDRGWAVVDAVRAVAEKHDATCSAVALAWLLAKPETSSIIVGARTVAQLEENLAALELALEPADLEPLDSPSRPEWG